MRCVFVILYAWSGFKENFFHGAQRTRDCLENKIFLEVQFQGDPPLFGIFAQSHQDPNQTSLKYFRAVQTHSSEGL